MMNATTEDVEPHALLEFIHSVSRKIAPLLFQVAIAEVNGDSDKADDEAVDTFRSLTYRVRELARQAHFTALKPVSEVLSDEMERLKAQLPKESE